MSWTFQALTMWRRESGLERNLLDELTDLIDLPSIGGRPGTPLITVNRAQIAFVVGPFIPDADAMFVEVSDVGTSGKKPQKFVDDGAKMHFLGGEQGKSFLEVKPHLVPEDTESSRSGAVILLGAMIEDVLKQGEILLHGPN